MLNIISTTMFKLIMISAIAAAINAATSIASDAKTVHDFVVKDINGREVNLSQYKGKKLLIVNVASQCGYTPQYSDLEKLHELYGSKIAILGFPANNFGGQEPGSNSEIATFCQKNYGVKFAMFEKVSVKGDDQAPLFKYLSNKSENGVVDQAPSWNFCKYLIDENGKVIKFFKSGTNPLSSEITDYLK